MAKFFIDRPIFAWVIAIIIMVLGLVSAYSIPVNMYPNIAPPTISIEVVYPGASATDLEDSVISIIENEMNGAPGLVDIESKSESSGMGSIALRFVSGTDDRFAQIEVQNRLQQAIPRLPAAVVQQGISISRASSDTLMFVSLTSNSDSLDVAAISDYTARNIIPEIRRIKGVGKVALFAAERSMRIWLDSNKLAGLKLNTHDVVQAIRAQNVQVAAGAIGENPSSQGQTITASVAIDGNLTNEQQFGEIIVRANLDGSAVKIKDIARVELGVANYQFAIHANGKPASGFMVYLTNDGNALETSAAIHKKITELEPFFPEGMQWFVPFDSAEFVSISITQVTKTLFEAAILVFLVMLLFLQNIRYSIIATIVVPISLLGTVAVLFALGYSINVLSMFAFALVIGIVVDDAIVVVENVDRIIAEEKLPPLQAAHKAMQQISGAVIGVTVVLLSVFLPLFFFSGSTGNIYRQFSLTMSTAIAFSAFMALTLTPALCATFIKPHDSNHNSWSKFKFFNWFNNAFAKISNSYSGKLNTILQRSLRLMLIYLLITLIAVWGYSKLPSSFIPAEDNGLLMGSVQLPANATTERTEAVLSQVSQYLEKNSAVESVNTVSGFSFSGAGQNAGFAFVELKDWGQRQSTEQQAEAIAQRSMAELNQLVDDAFVIMIPAPTIMGLSQSLEILLQDRNNHGAAALIQARNQLLGMMAGNPILVGTYPDGLADANQLKLQIDRNKAAALGIDFASVGDMLSTALSSTYVNNFINNGRSQRVVVQNDAAFRMQPEDVLKLEVTSNFGKNVPLSAFASVSWESAPVQAVRYNGYPTMKINTNPAPGYSMGEAIEAVQAMQAKLPPGFSIAWGGMAKEQLDSGYQTSLLYGFTILAIFLCLAALYESWSIPLSVILVVPLGAIGVIAMTMLRGMPNDIYFQVGLVTVIGLSAKNAILIVEFAKELQQKGLSALQAALQAAHLRFRPIIMTSAAFTIGVLPLFFASGAGSASRRAVGTGVVGGMISGTLLTIFLVPIFFVVIRSIFKSPLAQTTQESSEHE